MRRYLPLLLLSSCTIQQQNGGELRLDAPPLLVGQQWKITQQAKLKNGDRICTVSAGEMDVTQRNQGGKRTQEVALSGSFGVGYNYKIQVGSHYYETLDKRFDARESQAIIADLQTNAIAYSELREIPNAVSGGRWRVLSNKIPLAGFPAPYKACTQFLGQKR